MTEQTARRVGKAVNWARRKTWAFYCVQMIVCAPAAFQHGITWPLTALSGGTFLVYVGAISTEKILMMWIEKKGGHRGGF